MAEETKQQEVTFISRFRKLRIVMKAGYSREVDGHRTSTPGESIRFEDGQYTTDNPAIIDFIRKRPEFGNHIQEVPQNVEDLNAHAEARFQNLEEREADIAAREAALAAREAEVTDQEAGRAPEGNEEGAGNPGTTDDPDGEQDSLDQMERGDLIEELKAAKEEDPENETLQTVNGNSKSEDIVAALRAVRADKAAFND